MKTPKKKKDPFTLHTTRRFLRRDINTQVGLPTLRSYRAIIDHQLDRLHAPVTRIDKDTLDPIALEVSVLMATLRSQGKAR